MTGHRTSAPPVLAPVERRSAGESVCGDAPGRGRGSLGPEHSRCEYAGCPGKPYAFRDGWQFCRAHVQLHDEEKVGALQDPHRDRGGRLIRREGPPTRDLVANLHALGLADREIAAQLGIGRTTVRDHRKTLGVGPNAVRNDVAPCGTRAGRMRHRDQGETACAPCVEADRAWHREHHRRKKQAA